MNFLDSVRLLFSLYYSIIISIHQQELQLIIVEVNNSNLNILLNLAQAYEAEFSLVTKKNPLPSGLYSLDTNCDIDHPSYLIYDKVTPIGFCIKTIVDLRHDISEFYVIPTYRRKGIAKYFATEIFKKYTGDWQVRQIRGADKAVSFWRAVINEFTSGHFSESQVDDASWGTVTRQIFKS